MNRARTRPCLTPRCAVALALTLTAALLLIAPAAPASAKFTRAQAAAKALTALGSAKGDAPVIVFGLHKPLGVGTRVRHTRVVKVAGQPHYFFYEDRAPGVPYPHDGRVALVSAFSGRVKLSKTVRSKPRINGKAPVFLRSRKAYASKRYRIFVRTRPVAQGTAGTAAPAPTANGALPSTNPFGPIVSNKNPKVDPQVATVKQDKPKNLVLTGSDPDGDMLLFEITKPPDHGTLSGQAPYVTYTPDAGYLGKDKFAFKATDGEAFSETAHATLDVVPLGSPPVVTASSGCTAYTEQSPAVTVDEQLTASDPDDTQFDSATVRVTNGFERGDDLLFTDQGPITGSYDDTTGTLTLSGTATVAAYETALRSVRYRNESAGSPPPTKDVEFTVNDAGSDSAPATKQLCIDEGDEGSNNAPVGETSEGALQYVENDGPLPIDAGFVATDADSANLSGATIAFVESQGSDEEELPPGAPAGSTFSFAPDEDEFGFEDQNGISGSYDDVTGVLTLSGSAPVADYEAAMRSVTYENSSEDPSDAPRAVRMRLKDTSGAQSKPIARGILVTPVNDAPVVTTGEDTGSYTGDDAPLAVDSGLTVGDVDDDNIESATVRITSGFEAGDALTFADDLGITGFYDAETGVLTLTGSAPVADYETALRSVTYSHAPGNPAGSRALELTVNDGDLDSAPAARAIEVNDKPVVDPADEPLAYTEGDGLAAIDPDIAATDADSATLVGATVQISSGFAAGQDQLVFSDDLGISGVYDDETGTLTLSGTAPVADYETALRAVRFNVASLNPSSDTRTVSFQVDDGGSSNNLSDVATRDVTVTPVNNAPEVTTSSGSTAYALGDPAAAIDDAVTVADVDDTNIESATVRIASGFEAGDELAFADDLGITGGFDSETGVLTLTGSAPVADYETALRSVTYVHTGETPAESKPIEFTVNDGDLDSAAATKSVEITVPPTALAPVITTSEGTTAYTLDDAAGVAIDDALTVADADDANLESAQVQIAGFEPGDDLLWADQLGITGGFDSETGVLSLTGSAPVADYQTALRSVKFRHFGDNQSAFRTLELKVNDGDSDSNVAFKTVDLLAPVVP